MTGAVDAFSLPFEEQSAFLRDKLNLPTAAWTDIYGAEHDWSFVVAGANRDALVADFRQAVQRAIDDGGTLADFRKDFDAIVERHGWTYNGGRNWRSRTIFETNLRSSYQAGRYAQLLKSVKTRPYWQYRHSDAVEHPRPEHLAWDGLILRWDDPWWRWHFPVNAWGCHCSVVALSERDLKRLGRTGPDTAPEVAWETRTIGQRSPGGPITVQVPKGIDPGFEYTPGRARLESAVPRPRDGDLDIPATVPGLPNRTAPDPPPAPRAFPADRLLAEGLSEEDCARHYLAAFGATLDDPAIFADAIGERLVIGKGLFLNRRTGTLKAAKRGRGRYLPLLAEALRDPDEIWARLEWQAALGKAVVRRRYIARFEVDGAETPAVAVFEVGPDGWAGITTFPVELEGYVEALRQGIRLFRRTGQS